MTDQEPTDSTDWTYQDALAAARPRIERVWTFESDQWQANLREFSDSFGRMWVMLQPLLHQLGHQISAWALAQGPNSAPELSSALRFTSPTIRRRMAKRRARLVTRYHDRHQRGSA